MRLLLRLMAAILIHVLVGTLHNTVGTLLCLMADTLLRVTAARHLHVIVAILLRLTKAATTISGTHRHMRRKVSRPPCLSEDPVMLK
jgi:hypothetical protein